MIALVAQSYDHTIKTETENKKTIVKAITISRLFVSLFNLRIRAFSCHCTVPIDGSLNENYYTK